MSKTGAGTNPNGLLLLHEQCEIGAKQQFNDEATACNRRENERGGFAYAAPESIQNDTVCERLDDASHLQHVNTIVPLQQH